MTKPIDIEKAGKKVPYRVPEGFFETMQQQVLERVGEKPRRRSPLYVRISSAVIGVAAVVSAFVFLPGSYPDEQQASVQPRLTAGQTLTSSWVEQLSDDDLQAMDDFSDYDIFMN